jgi:hypothetical protein
MLSEVGRVVGCLTGTKALDGVGADVARADGTLGTVRARLETCREARDLAPIGILADWWWFGWVLGLRRVR